MNTMEIEGLGEVAAGDGLTGHEALRAFPSEIEQREPPRRPCLLCGAEKRRDRPICDACLCDPARLEAAMQPTFLPAASATRSDAESQAPEPLLRRVQMHGETFTSWLVKGIVGRVALVGLAGVAVWLFWRLLRAVVGF